ncbi:MAG TPA: ATP-binding cassette domain-containing protein [Acidobacteriaceae bacterium]|nr:ATP-binding cassette domain-containing protein [Acidobacteriaceae bacterium]
MSDARKTIELDRVTKSYGSKVAVHDLSLAIEAGQMFGLLGPNGAGKTSTIRMMIGMTLPDSGTVTLFGQPFTRHSLHRVGYLPEERGLYKKMKVVDQLVLLGQLHGLNATQAENRAREWCERLEIAGSLEKRTEELSKGMQQKIQFIAAILHNPELIIMDEPFSGLDPVNAIMLQDVLTDLKHKGKAILFSTHRMDQVERLCDAICLVNQGQAVLSGTVRGVKSRYPKNRVRIRYEGDSTFLAHPSIGGVIQNNGTAEIRLRQGSDPQEILIAAMAYARVSYFDVIEPTLEEIFIETVGGKFNA